MHVRDAFKIVQELSDTKKSWSSSSQEASTIYEKTEV